MSWLNRIFEIDYSCWLWLHVLYAFSFSLYLKSYSNFYLQSFKIPIIWYSVVSAVLAYYIQLFRIKKWILIYDVSCYIYHYCTASSVVPFSTLSQHVTGPANHLWTLLYADYTGSSRRLITTADWLLRNQLTASLVKSAYHSHR